MEVISCILCHSSKTTGNSHICLKQKLCTLGFTPDLPAVFSGVKRGIYFLQLRNYSTSALALDLEEQFTNT